MLARESPQPNGYQPSEKVEGVEVGADADIDDHDVGFKLPKLFLRAKAMLAVANVSPVPAMRRRFG